MAGRTLEDGVGQDRLDGVQTDGAGLRQAGLGPGAEGLGGAVVPAVGPAHTDTNTSNALLLNFNPDEDLSLVETFSIIIFV